ncbi:hypothetical protein RxyAA322_15100 [Rubrobacter xylanophilus]|uniref:Thioredoxin domain-containing protein n=1 Tax=Rubrobacter xylanophilus TaxID=49319 RepID=A0A510HI30_9ACTN|nr:hypothetical protein RxyAA322_15100 [Rubrobacter xylanophilus]
MAVLLVVALAAVLYRTFGSAETGTGTLTLPEPAPTEGERAPTFEVHSEEGGTFRLTEKGIYVLTFWSTLNRGSMEARPAFEAVARRYGGEGVRFAAVYVNSAPDDSSIAYTVLQDRTGRLTSLYNVKRVPRLFVIENGTIRLVQNGYYEGNRRQLEQVLEESLRREENRG